MYPPKTEGQNGPTKNRRVKRTHQNQMGKTNPPKTEGKNGPTKNRRHTDPTKNRRQTDHTKNRRCARRSCFLLDTRRVNHIVRSYENLVGNRKKRKKVLCIMICFSSRLSVVPRLLFQSFRYAKYFLCDFGGFFLSITGSLTCSGYACTCRDSLH